MKKNWTGERLETFVMGRQVVDHLHRYAIAEEYCRDKVVLDIACGEGYGSNIICKSASLVYGVDIDADTIENAKIKYRNPNLDFLVGSTSSIPVADNLVDVVVSFETIEHHDAHFEMLTEIKRVLKPGGIVLISTPDKLYYSDKRNYINPFHVKELYEDEFYNLIANFFGELQILKQFHINGNSIIKEESENLKVYSGSFDSLLPSEATPLFLICIASESVFKMQKYSVFDGQNVVKNEAKYIQQKIYSSTTYRIGNLITAPVKFLNKYLKLKRSNKLLN